MIIINEIRLPGETYRVEIQNDCTGNAEVGNYNVQLIRQYPRGKASIKRIHVEGHKRGDWRRLLAQVFAELAREKGGSR